MQQKGSFSMTRKHKQYYYKNLWAQAMGHKGDSGIAQHGRRLSSMTALFSFVSGPQ